MKDIVRITRINFQLDKSNETKVGDVVRNGTVDGIIGHLYRNVCSMKQATGIGGIFLVNPPGIKYFDNASS